jgi:hypothetical protein
MALVACPLTGRVFDLDAVTPDPYKRVPGSDGLPADQAGIDILYPVPSGTDPKRDEKLAVRAQAITRLPAPVA